MYFRLKYLDMSLKIISQNLKRASEISRENSDFKTHFIIIQKVCTRDCCTIQKKYGRKSKKRTFFGNKDVTEALDIYEIMLILRIATHLC